MKITAFALAALAVLAFGGMAMAQDTGEGERPSKEEILEKYDANGNGKLDPEERKKLHDEMGGRRGGRERGGRGRHGGPGGQGGPGGEGRPTKEEILKKFDANGDGELDEDERKALREEIRKRRGGRGRRGGPGGRGGPEGPGGEGRPTKEEILEKYDANGNGKLDPEERKKLHDEMGGRRGGRGRRGGHGGPGGPGGEGRPTREEILKKFDANGDGELDEEERKALREEIRKRRGGRGRGGRGGHGGRGGGGERGGPGGPDGSSEDD